MRWNGREVGDPHDRQPDEETGPLIEEMACPRCGNDCVWRQDLERGDHWFCPVCREPVPNPWEE